MPKANLLGRKKKDRYIFQMPTVFKFDGFRFFFYSNEGNPLKPIHIHVIKGGDEAKIWLEPEVLLARSKGFNAKTLRHLLKLVNEHRPQIEGAWREYFG